MWKLLWWVGPGLNPLTTCLLRSTCFLCSWLKLSTTTCLTLRASVAIWGQGRDRVELGKCSRNCTAPAVRNPPLGEEQEEDAKRYFGSLGQTMLSLFMSISGGVSWEEMVFPLQEWDMRTRVPITPSTCFSWPWVCMFVFLWRLKGWHSWMQIWSCHVAHEYMEGNCCLSACKRVTWQISPGHPQTSLWRRFLLCGLWFCYSMCLGLYMGSFRKYAINPQTLQRSCVLNSHWRHVIHAMTCNVSWCLIVWWLLFFERIHFTCCSFTHGNGWNGRTVFPFLGDAPWGFVHIFRRFKCCDLATTLRISVGERNVTHVAFTKLTKLFVQDLLLGRCLLVVTNHDHDLKDVTDARVVNNVSDLFLFFMETWSRSKIAKKIVATMFCKDFSANNKHIAHRYIDYLVFWRKAQEFANLMRVARFDICSWNIKYNFNF